MCLWEFTERIYSVVNGNFQVGSYVDFSKHTRLFDKRIAIGLWLISVRP